ncbi:TIGR04283 family arsenosugar biosynthesis glycosyltransferase [Phormidium tenue]|uniref:4,4'-diaponeurosporenoate glycosyltransferase n=1 Tax=Phormidium tenue NIES-30 TaxID=549789 RepID=A0A1U7IYP1_9CYAN|nr:TIGR04283 family arsenosugar biosynthesis glycosyltransferase [Phormidium tenue]MBD2234841.1 TIGR04283 family arsenosugar biosynthesis glycosyltransferase [Phormidium tenue FACHB-1052]OKH43799.1 glycosyltransferase [Phormidium tenue NIES-30]
MPVSIIIPTWNEAACLDRTLSGLQGLSPPPREILLVDGGSRDRTLAIALAWVDRLPLTVLQAPAPGRSVQMNWGATAAKGDVLCFLHADTLIPDDLVQVVESTLANPRVAGGGFISLMAGPQKIRWGISLHNALKTYYAPLLFRPHLFIRGLRLLFGDQVMFCRRADFMACGGFDPALPIMEEADLCLKLCRRGRLRQLSRVVQSSDRRVAAWGTLKANAIYLMIGVLWGIGVPATTLKRFYEEVR